MVFKEKIQHLKKAEVVKQQSGHSSLLLITASHQFACYCISQTTIQKGETLGNETPVLVTRKMLRYLIDEHGVYIQINRHRKMWILPTKLDSQSGPKTLRAWPEGH